MQAIDFCVGRKFNQFILKQNQTFVTFSWYKNNKDLNETFFKSRTPSLKFDNPLILELKLFQLQITFATLLHYVNLPEKKFANEYFFHFQSFTVFLKFLETWCDVITLLSTSSKVSLEIQVFFCLFFGKKSINIFLERRMYLVEGRRNSHMP